MALGVFCHNATVLADNPAYIYCEGPLKGNYYGYFPDEFTPDAELMEAGPFVNALLDYTYHALGRSDEADGPFVSNPLSKNGTLTFKQPIKGEFVLWLQGVPNSAGNAWFSLYLLSVSETTGITSIPFNTDGILQTDIAGPIPFRGPVLAFAAIFVADLDINLPPPPPPPPAPEPPAIPGRTCTRQTFSPDESGYAVTFPAETNHQALEGGLGRYRKDFITVNAKARAQWTLSNRDLSILVGLFEVAATSFIVLDLFVDKATVKTTHSVYLIPGTLKYVSKKGDRQVVSCEIEIIRGETLTSWPLPL